jgi:hypothetical protein
MVSESSWTSQDFKINAAQLTSTNVYGQLGRSRRIRFRPVSERRKMKAEVTVKFRVSIEN